MSSRSWNITQALRALVADEQGTLHKEAPRRVALVYPSPYRAAMSSLGYQTIYRLLNHVPDLAADRAMLPDDVAAHVQSGAPLLTLEREQPVSAYPVLGFSVAYELEIAGMIDCLRLAGVPVLASERGPGDPLIVAGGPLTFSNPAPMAPFCDVILLGEAEEILPALLEQVWDRDREQVMAWAAGRPGFYVPARDGDHVPPIAAVDDALLPARSQIITPHTELSSMFLTEAVRGCAAAAPTA